MIYIEIWFYVFHLWKLFYLTVYRIFSCISASLKNNTLEAELYKLTKKYSNSVTHPDVKPFESESLNRHFIQIDFSNSLNIILIWAFRAGSLQFVVLVLKWVHIILEIVSFWQPLWLLGLQYLWINFSDSKSLLNLQLRCACWLGQNWIKACLSLLFIDVPIIIIVTPMKPCYVRKSKIDIYILYGGNWLASL